MRMMVDSNKVVSSSGRPDVIIDEMHLMTADVVGRNFEKLFIFVMLSLLSPPALLFRLDFNLCF